jgi:hypothetical protein
VNMVMNHGGEFLEYLSVLLASPEGFCSMEFVRTPACLEKLPSVNCILYFLFSIA